MHCQNPSRFGDYIYHVTVTIIWKPYWYTLTRISCLFLTLAKGSFDSCSKNRNLIIWGVTGSHICELPCSECEKERSLSSCFTRLTLSRYEDGHSCRCSVKPTLTHSLSGKNHCPSCNQCMRNTPKAPCRDSLALEWCFMKSWLVWCC